MTVNVGPLGQTANYPTCYDPELLFAIPRAQTRGQAGIAADVDWLGEDIWNAYEFSWLDPQGRVQTNWLRLRVPAESPRLVESKSVKLYLGSLSQESYADAQTVQKLLQADFAAAIGSEITLEVLPLEGLDAIDQLQGICVDDAAPSIDCYERNPRLLQPNDSQTLSQTVQSNRLYSHNFRSLCPVTGQPDFASVWVEYQGPGIAPAALSAYLTSYRLHQAFHETTIEQIYLDLWTHCACTELTVRGQFLRRGGIDINPYRSSRAAERVPLRLARQ